MPRGLEHMHSGFFDTFDFYATSLIPDADTDTGDFTFEFGYVAISPYREGEVYFVIAGTEDPTGDDADNDGNRLVLDLVVNGAAQTISFDFELDDGFGWVIDDLDLDDDDAVQVVQVRVQQPIGDANFETFGIPGLTIND